MVKRLSVQSQDINQERMKELQRLFPEAFVEDKIDFEKLKQMIGEQVEIGPERYGMNWAGKSDAIRTIQTQSTGTLRPTQEESVHFDTTENLMIEGDNLEVLKLLRKSYYGKVKMIYIDPPYNTGNDFVYADDYKDGIHNYLKQTGQLDDDGNHVSTNKDTDGRYHSKWMNMMYPRLLIARQLLKDDGVIFVSIDDGEVHNLRFLMNEVFGEENFISNVVWHKKYTRSNDAKWFSDNHDHILVAAKNKEKCRFNLLPKSEKQLNAYGNPDNHSKGLWKATPLHAKSGNEEVFSYTFKNGNKWSPPSGTYPRFSINTLEELEKNDEIWFGKNGNSIPSRKSFLSEVKDGLTPITLWPHDEVGHNHEASDDMKKLFPENIFNNPKPVRLIKRMIELATNENDIIVDFFAGSGTTGQACIEKNIESKRNFILVQFPESTPERSAARRAGFQTIADITKERIRRVIHKHKEEQEQTLDFDDDHCQGLGFKVFKLDTSNIKIWDGTNVETVDDLHQQLDLFVEPIIEDRTDADLLYEIILKAGLPLTVDVERMDIEGRPVYWVNQGALLICVADQVDASLMRAMMDAGPEQIICLDHAFGEHDELKTNIVLEMKTKQIAFRTI